MVKLIEENGGTVKFKNRVNEIMIRNHTAYGVKTDIGEIFKAKVIVSNASAHDTFYNMINEYGYLKNYLKKIDKCKVSLSCFQIFLGLKKDLISELDIKDAEPVSSSYSRFILVLKELLQ